MWEVLRARDGWERLVETPIRISVAAAAVFCVLLLVRLATPQVIY